LISTAFGFIRPDELPADQMRRLRRGAHVHGDDVRLAHYIVQRQEFDAFDVAWRAVPCHNPRPERLGQFRHAAADIAGADDAEGLARDFVPAQPLAGLCRTRGDIIGLHVTQERQRKQHDELGHGLVRIARAVAHGDAVLAAVVEVDMIEPDKCHRDGAQLGAVFQHGAAQGEIRHDQSLGVLGALDEFAVIGGPRVVGAHRDILRQRVKLGLQRGVRHS
jgi:hypothetical protein